MKKLTYLGINLYKLVTYKEELLGNWKYTNWAILNTNKQKYQANKQIHLKGKADSEIGPIWQLEGTNKLSK